MDKVLSGSTTPEESAPGSDGNEGVLHIPQNSSLAVAQRIEVLSLYGSRWALSEDSGFKSYPSWLEVYLVKKMVR